MFGFSKKRIAALRRASESARELLEAGDNDNVALHSLVRGELRDALSSVIDHDLDAVFEDVALRDEFDQAKARVSALDDAITKKRRRLRWTADSVAAAELAARYKLRRCRECDGAVFFVRESVRVETPEKNLDLAMITCEGCGDVRFRARSAELEAIADDADQRRVELPAKAPFRG